MENNKSLELIKAEIERRKKENMFVDLPMSIGRYYEDRELLSFIDSLPEETSCIYDTNELTPTPSVNIEDVARVQFASHAHVFDRKRKAVFDWEQFKEVVGIFYGFGKKNSMPEETKDAEQAAARYERENRQSILSSVDIVNAFIDGAKWQAMQLLKGSPLPEDTVLFQKGVAEGRRLERDDGGLAWQDIKSIVHIADNLLDDTKARVELQNHNEEYYYKRVLDEYDRLHKTQAE